MPWPIVSRCPEFVNMHWIHPLFQERVGNMVQYVRERYPFITYVIVFGSVTTNRCTSWSDIDVCIFGDYNLKFVPPDDGTAYDVLWAQHLNLESDIWKRIESDGVLVYGQVSS